MARNKFCIRVDGLDSEERKELHEEVNKIVSDYAKKKSEQKSEPTEDSE